MEKPSTPTSVASATVTRVPPLLKKRCKRPGTPSTVNGESTAAVDATASSSAITAKLRAARTAPSGNTRKNPSAPRVVAWAVW